MDCQQLLCLADHGNSLQITFGCSTERNSGTSLTTSLSNLTNLTFTLYEALNVVVLYLDTMSSISL